MAPPAGTTPLQPPFAVAPPDYRLPPETRTGAVHLQVSRLEASCAFYQEVVGFRLLGADASRAWLGAGASDAVLVQLTEHPGARPVPRHGRLGLYHVAVLLPDRPALARFAGHLVRRGLRPGAADHAVSEAFYLNDPDGLGVEVYADRPRAAWPVSGGRLGLTTQPLDLASLLAADRGTWEGLPEGTTIGHVHLHVGDLQRASHFYHEALGLDRVAEMPGALFLSAGGYHHHLGTNMWAAGAAPAGADDARLVEWTLVVPGQEDVRAAAASLRAAGYEVRDTSVDVLVADPWGTALRVAAVGAGAP